MKRTGIKIGTDAQSQTIRLTLFEEENHNHNVTVSLDATQTLSVINQLLRATEKLDVKPKQSAVRALLIEALKSFDAATED